MSLNINLAPGLLLSMPQLSDPHFTRAVVLMLDHTDEGSFGLVLNHASTMEVAELVGHIEVEWCGDPEAKVYSGGPVMPGSAWAVHSGCKLLPEASSNLDDAMNLTGNLRVNDGLFMSTSEENIKILSESPPDRLRVLLGYSGWAGGQLAQEMAQGSWLHADINTDILFDAPPDQMWELCLRDLGIDPESIVQSHGVH